MEHKGRGIENIVQQGFGTTRLLDVTQKCFLRPFLPSGFHITEIIVRKNKAALLLIRMLVPLVYFARPLHAIHNKLKLRLS